MRSQSSNTKASALLITLVLMVLITVLVIGLLETATLEGTSAASYLEETRAEFCAKEGIDRVTATLRANTVPQGTITNYWISQPGQIVVSDATTPTTATNRLLDTPIPLSSGVAGTASITSTVPYFHPANLNIPSFSDPTSFLVTESENANGALVQMQMKWVYVRSSGTLDTNDIPNTANATDPIIGRYAYWTDDESSKVNYNLAWARDAANTGPVSYPTRINLTALTGVSSIMADSIHNSITANTGTNYGTTIAPLLVHGFYNSPDDGRRVSAAVASALKTNHFDVTHYNNDPDTSLDMTYFGSPKIFLTTQANRVPQTNGVPAYPFIDILTASTATTYVDPGTYSNVDNSGAGGKLDKTMQLLVSYLIRTDWPMAYGSSFQSKYNDTANYNGRIAQLAINIIDYVRCKESTKSMVQPLRIVQSNQISASYPNGTYAISASTTTSGQSDFLGIGRGPVIDEIGAWFPASAVPPFTAQETVEIYLPINYGLPSVDLSKITLETEIETANGYNATPSAPITGTEISSINGSANPGGLTILNAGQYAVVTQAVPIPGVPFLTYPASPRPTTVDLRVAMSPSGGPLTIMPLADKLTWAIIAQLDAPGVALNNIHSMELDDPRLGQNEADWQTCKNASQPYNTFGSPNSVSTIGSAASSSISPEQDTDASGNISAASLFMPPPAGTSYNGYDNTAGVVSSVGELGYIHTGIDSYGLAARAGTSWRTLRLQPSKLSTANPPVVPDWALMDLFTVPASVSSGASTIFRPNVTSVGGRINLNAQLQPFSPPPANSTNWPSRLAPLTALFYGSGNNSTNLASTNSLSVAQTIAQNIYNGTLAANGKAYGGTTNAYSGANNYYVYPGQLAEISGVSDGGELSEENIRQVASLVTVQGNVFTVYSIGQAIKQTPSGQLTITSESRLQSMIERYVNATTGAVNFRTVYYRTMTQ